MAGNPSYSGVPNGVAPGTAVQTGGAGSSNVSDYHGMPVYRQNAAGQWIQLPPDYEIPGGATVSIGAPPASNSGGGGSGNTVTGYGIVDQAETNRHNVESEGIQRQQNTNTAAYQQGSLANDAQRNQIAMQQLQVDQKKAEMQFQLDTQRFGLDQARFNFDQNVAQADAKYKQATLGLQGAQFSLSQNQFNASQRQAQEAARENIMKMLADKSGPADWVAYNRLVNGLAAPTPTSTTISDPFAGLKDLYKESNIAAPAIPDLTPAGVTFAPSAVSGNFLTASGSSSSQPALPAGAAGNNGFAPAGGGNTQSFGSDGVNTNPNQAIANRAVQTAVEQPNRRVGPNPFRTGPIPTEGGGAPPRPPLLGPSGFSPESTAAHEAALRIPYTGSALPPLFSRGGSSSGMAITGDTPSEDTPKELANDPHTELTYAYTAPDGGSGFKVLPHEQLQQLLDKVFGNRNGRVMGAHKMPKGFLDDLPRAATGGTFERSPATTYDPLTNNPIGGDMLQPLSGETSITQSKPGIGGPTGIQTPGSATPAPAAPMYGGTAGASHDPNPTGPISAPGTQVNQGTGANAPGGGITPGMSTSGGGALPPSSVQLGAGAPAADANLLGPVGSQPGGNNQPAFRPDAPGTYGGEAYQDWIKTNVYDPSILGSQPFIQQMNGTMDPREFGGFGAKISNPALGIENFNPLFSLQRYNQLLPSAQKQYQSLINQGLGLSFDDLRRMAELSAPVGHNRSGYGLGIQSNAYGR